MPGIPGIEQRELVCETHFRGTRAVDPWGSVSNGVDFQHLRTLHGLSAVDPDAVAVGPHSLEYRIDVSQPHPDRYPDLMRAIARARRTMTTAIEALVEADIFHGNPELLGLAFWSAMHGLVMLHLAGKLPGDPDFETIRREIMRLLVTGARTAA